MNNKRTRKSNFYLASYLLVGMISNHIKYGLMIGLPLGIVSAFIPPLSKFMSSNIGTILVGMIIGIYVAKVTVERAMKKSAILKEQLIKVPIIIAIIQLIATISIDAFIFMLPIELGISILSIFIGYLSSLVPIIVIYVFLKKQYNDDINNNIIPEDFEREDPKKEKRWFIINIGLLVLIIITAIAFVIYGIHIYNTANI